MVAPVREIANKQLSTTRTYSKFSNMAKTPSRMNMNINNCNTVIKNQRERSSFSSNTISRSALVILNTLSELYYQKMKQYNNLLDNIIVDSIDCSQLSYNNKNEGEGNPVSKAANSNTAKKQQHVYNKDMAMRRASNSNKHMYNMQISYDVNQALDTESWDSNFHVISLYGSMDHLASDAKNIKESLCCM